MKDETHEDMRQMTNSVTEAIVFKDVSKFFKTSDTPAVNNVSLSIHTGEFITILGSSGCGKTTLLKMVNRLYEPSCGSIELFGEDSATVDKTTLRRRIGYVIQRIGLFPHMTLGENIAVVPKLMQWSKEAISARVDELLALVGLAPEEFRNRYPDQLSGGQQQRVGLARALAIDPKIMLLDEPFGALDNITRTVLQDELFRLHRGMGKTFLFVTHDINEAMKLGDRVIVMDKGRVVQFATPREVVCNPADDFTAKLVQSARQQEKLWESLTC